MVKIICTQRSLTDLKSIAEYISKDSEKYASITIERILDVAMHLKNNPKIGRKVPEVEQEEGIREIISGHYRIIYKISSPLIVHILTVHHSSRRLRQSHISQL